ncbi:hypothetical protein SAMN05660297_02198 [Natronincola peptidivorans]|uniref:Uncharacterized protein n=1 Tax=Natronincola peptidivorans TaxID=426128 RepID=A0A1I0DZS4_9FIRM|nr:hypothetical protein SAMN05660297_02198 [Natronincola peptidivorans]
MDNQVKKIKALVLDLEKDSNPQSQISLLQELIASAEACKKHLLHIENLQKQEKAVIHIDNVDLQIEKISEEIFLYKSVMVKNYYDGDYLERFSEIRTSDLKTSGAFDIHNRFWKAHEVCGGNIFATVPLALIEDGQSTKLQRLHWDPVQVEVYEIINDVQSKLSRGQIINAVEKMFNHYLLVRELCGNIMMVLHYKI